MSKTLKTEFKTTPDSHASANGHWDKVQIDLEGKGTIGTPPVLQIQFQNGPVKEHGVNGVQLPAVLRICLARYRMLNKSFPCRDNALVITKLEEAIMRDDERTAKRCSQGIEGFDRPHLED